MGNKAMVLIVEDNVRMLDAMARVIKGAGHHVFTAGTLREARAHLKKVIPDVLVLDILLPDGNGLDFIDELRRTTTAPVLIVTSLGAKDERLAGLSAGGDDYITKPFDLDELAARVNAFLRREAIHRQNPVQEIVKGLLTLNPVAGKAYLLGEDMLLTQKEFALLYILAQNEGKILSKEALFEGVWKQPVNDDARAIKTHISNVRRKLTGSGYAIIVSRGEGYCFETSYE